MANRKPTSLEHAVAKLVASGAAATLLAWIAWSGRYLVRVLSTGGPKSPHDIPPVTILALGTWLIVTGFVFVTVAAGFWSLGRWTFWALTTEPARPADISDFDEMV